MGKRPVAAALGFGISSYCLALLVSKDAPFWAVTAMGTMSVCLMSVSMWALWSPGSFSPEAPADRPKISGEREKSDEVIR